MLSLVTLSRAAKFCPCSDVKPTMCAQSDDLCRISIVEVCPFLKFSLPCLFVAVDYDACNVKNEFCKTRLHAVGGDHVCPYPCSCHTTRAIGHRPRRCIMHVWYARRASSCTAPHRLCRPPSGHTSTGRVLRMQIFWQRTFSLETCRLAGVSAPTAHAASFWLSDWRVGTFHLAAEGHLPFIESMIES